MMLMAQLKQPDVATSLRLQWDRMFFGSQGKPPMNTLQNHYSLIISDFTIQYIEGVHQNS